MTAFNNNDNRNAGLFHSTFEALAARSPDVPAVVLDNVSITYGDLDVRANAVAHKLRNRGVTKSHRVGILAERSIDLIVGIFGALKASAAYVVLDRSFPVSRLAVMVDEAALNVVMYMDGTKSILDDVTRTCGSTLRALHLSDFVGNDFLPAEHDVSKLPDLASPEDTAFVVFTSGSTGKPKGVMVPHQGVTRLLDEPILSDNIRPGDRIAQFHSIGFDLAQQDVFMALSLGASLHLRAVDDAFRVLRNVDVLTITPTGLAQLDPASLPNIKLIYTCGENLPQAVSDRWAGGVKLYNVYGPAETSLIATGALMAPGVEVGIGRPLAHTSVFICDENLRPVEGAGVVGEICIGGVAVTNGYINSEEKTKERFVNLPDDVEGGMKVYRTGDLGRWSEDGQLFIIGRNDNQVKLKGYRVELDEVANVVTQRPGVRVCAAVVRDDVLVAYYSPADGADPAAIRAFVSARLPAYMVPSVFVGLDAVPLNANGKIDRAELAARPLPAAVGEDLALTDAERRLATVWRAVLGTTRPIGRETSFFALGGDSLTLMRMCAAAANAGFRFAALDVFRGPELRSLAAVVAEEARSDGRVENFDDGVVNIATEVLAAHGLDSSEVEDVYPATAIQAGMIAESRRAAGDCAAGQMYVASRTWVVEGGDVTADMVEMAWRAVVGANDVLRTRFVSTMDQIFQVVVKSIDPVQQIDEAAEQTFFDEPFNFDNECLCRMAAVMPNSSAYASRIHLRIHHALYDGQSLEILAADFVKALSGAALEGGPSFKGFVSEILRRSESESRVYWTRTLEGIGHAEALSFPAALEENGAESISKQSFRVATASLDWDRSVLESLGRMAESNRVTLASVLRGVWAILLRYYSRKDDIVFGDTHSGRNVAVEGIDRMIGALLNTIPCRIDLKGSMSFQELIQKCHEAYFGSLPYDHVGPADIKRWCKLAGDCKLFNSIFIFQGYEKEESKALDSHVVLKDLGVKEEFLNEWIIEFTAKEDGLSTVMTYDANAIPADVAHRMVAKLDDIVRRLASAASASSPETVTVRELSALSPLDLAAVSQLGLSPSNKATPNCELFHTRFERLAAEHPDTPAVVDPTTGTTMTYGDMNRRSNAIAHALAGDLGVGRGDNVGLVVNRSIEFIVGLLAIVKAGAAYVVLNASFPTERLATMAREASCGVFLHADNTADALAALMTATSGDGGGAPLGLRNVNVSDYVSGPIESEVDLARGPAVSNEDTDTAFIVFTSGSTGKPKGVMVPHRGMTRYLDEPLFTDHVTPGDRFAQLMSIGFDAAQTEIYVTLSSGSTLYLVGPDPLATFALVNVLQITPTGLAAIDPDDYPDLRVVYVGGEQLPRSLADRWGPKVVLLNLYGPTEVSDNALGCRIFGGSEVTVGRPFVNSEVYVMDTEQELVPPGVIGEVVVGGLCISNGYINSPEGNATKFIQDQFRSKGSRMYRTGDLGRWLPNGHMQMIGRSDNQVKLRGYRIELDEIANVICSHPLIKLAAAVVKGNVLIAYVSPNDVAKEELRATVAKRLPHYMIPSKFVGMEEMPMNSNGKIDRALLNSLPLPELDDSDVNLGDAEERLAGIWRTLLKTASPIGRNTSFFELGGDSMTLIRMTVAATEAGFAFTAATVFKTPFLAALAAIVADPSSRPQQTAVMDYDGPLASPETLDMLAAGCYSAYGIDPDAVVDVYPTTPLQTGMLTESFRDPSRYVVCQVWEMEGLSIVEDNVRRAWGKFINSHAVLRTRFVNSSEGIYQVVMHNCVDSSLEYISSVAESIDAVQTSLVERNLAMGFKLESEFLRRLTVVNIQGTKRCRVILSLHHAIYDGHSYNILAEDFIKSLLGQPLSHSPNYRSFVMHVNSRSEMEVRKYWEAQLEGLSAAEPLSLPVDRGTKAEIRVKTCQLNPAVLSSVRMLSKTYKTTIVSVMRAVWALTIRYYTRNDDIVFGDVRSCRDAPIRGVESMVGLLLNTLPFRLQIKEDMTFAQVVSRAHETYASSLPFDHIGLGDAKRYAKIRKDAALFDSIFLFQTSDDRNLIESSELSVVDLGLNGSGWDQWGVEFSTSAAGLKAAISYDQAMIPESAIQSMFAKMQEVVMRAAGNQRELLVGDLDSLLPDHSSVVLSSGTSSHTQSPEYELFHTRFEEIAAEVPHHIAVVMGNQSISYGELDTRANALANRLRFMGVVRGCNVGALMYRSIDMVIAIFAILKTGAAYVILDPKFPSERLATMALESKCSVLLHSENTKEQLCQVYQQLQSSGTCSMLSISDFLSDATDHVTTKLPDAVNGRDNAFIVFTSGSTGKPKGVAVHHQGMTRFLNEPLVTDNIAPGSNVAQFMSIGFDAAQYELFVALSLKCTLHLCESDPLKTLLNVDVVHITPTGLSALDVVAYNNLKVIVVGGEPIQRALADKWSSRVKLINVYGPTETALIQLGGRIFPSCEISAGSTLANSLIYVVDEKLHLVPPGVIGEVAIGGLCVTNGYINNPEGNATKFLKNPFISEEGLIYLTGDLGRWLPNGTMQIIGRKDTQVKLRGYRLELDEVANVLCSHQSVQLASAVVKNNILVAYVSPSGINEDELRDFVAEHLPHYMIPSKFVGMDKLPLSTNGKIDRKVLAAFELPETSDSGATLSEAELKLAQIWKSVLKTSSHINKGTSFFEMGGDSISAIRLVAAAKQAGMSITTAQVMKNVTLSGMCSVMQGAITKLVSHHDMLRCFYTRQRSGQWVQEIGLPDASKISVEHEEVSNLSELELLIHERQQSLSLTGGNVFRILLIAMPDRSQRLFFTIHHLVVDLVSWRIILSDLETLLTGGQLSSKTTSFQKWSTEIAASAVEWDPARWESYMGSPEPLMISTLNCGRFNVKETLDVELSAKLDAANAVHRTNVQDLILTALVLSMADVHKGDDPVQLCLEIEGHGREPWRGDLDVSSTVGWFTSVYPLLLEASKTSSIGEVIRQVKEKLRAVPDKGLSYGILRYLAPFQNPTKTHGGHRIAFNYLGRFQSLEGEDSFFSPDDVVEEMLDASPDDADFHPISINCMHAGKSLVLELTVTHGALSEARARIWSQSWSEWMNKVISYCLDSNTIAFHTLSDFPLMSSAEGIIEAEKALSAQFAISARSIEDMYPVTSLQFGLLSAMLQDPSEYTVVNVIDDVLFGCVVSGRDQALEGLERTVGMLINTVPVPLRTSNSTTVADFLKYVQSVSTDIMEHSHASLVDIQKWTKTQNLLESLLVFQNYPGSFSSKSLPYTIEEVDHLEHAGFPLERLRTMAEEASCNVVLHMDGTNDVLANLDLQIPPDSFSLSDFVGSKFAPSEHNVSKLNIQTTGADTAFIVFTSGSTGKPKGVMVPHYGMTRFANEPIVTENIHAGDKVAHFLSIGFDAAQWDTYVALSRGATLYLRGEDALSIMKQVDVVQITPSGLAALDPGAVGNLRVVYVGGEPLPQKLADEWCEKVKLYNICGPTEVSDIVLGGQMMKNEPVNIGGPLANSLIYIVDEQMNLVPPGVIGEIVVGGLTVSNGYINSAEGNATKFGPNPFDVSAGRIYCTGDLGRWLPNGIMQIIGRRENQVKDRGYSMELDDIAITISGHPGVRLAAVVVKDNVLIAYVTPKGIPSAELRDIVSARMPHYMVPACFVGMDALPLNANGKIDRALLKTFSLPETSEDDLQLSEVEEALAQVWRSVLKTTVPIGQNTSFFELGGDSISAIRLMAMAKQAGMGITAAEIMKHVTLKSMAAAIKTMPSPTLQATTDAELVLGRVPLTPIQHMFFKHPWKDINHYNQAFLLSVKRNVQLTTLKSAIFDLTQHHDMLRAKYTRQRNGDWIQEIALLSPSQINVREASLGSNEELPEVFRKAHESLSLTAGRLFAVVLITKFDGSQSLFFTVHHLVIDLVSWRIILADLETLLTGGKLSAKSTSFKDWSSLMIANSINYDPTTWESYMSHTKGSGCTASDVLPRFVSRGVLGAEASNKLDAANVPYGTNIQELVLAALVLSMANLENENRLVELGLNVEGHGREPWDNDIDVSATVGWFTTVYPVVFVAQKTSSISEVLRDVKQKLRAVPDKGLSYGVFKYLSKAQNAVKAHVGHEIAFNYFGRFQSIEGDEAFFTPDRTAIDLLDTNPNDSDFNPVSINCMHTDNGLLLEMTVTSGVFSKKQAERWMLNWAGAMTDIIDHCIDPATVGGRTLSDVPLMPSYNAVRQTETTLYSQHGITAKDIEDMYPVTPLQFGLLSAMMQAPSEYTIVNVLDIDGEMTISRESSAASETFWKATLASAASAKPLELPTAASDIEGEIPYQEIQTNNVVFGYIVSGRDRGLDGSERIAGMLINTIPIAVSAPSDMSVDNFLRYMQKISNDVMEHSHISLSDIQRWVNSQNLFDTLIDFSNYPELGDHSSTAFSFTEVEHLETTDIPLTLNIAQKAEDITMSLLFDIRKFSRFYITDVSEKFVDLLKKLVSPEPVFLKQLNCLSDPMDCRVKKLGAAPSNRQPSYDLFHSRFEEIALVSPDTIAVRDNERGKSITYKELDQRANAIANKLCEEFEVSNGCNIGLIVSRSIEFVVGLLGILKSGAAYVVLNSSFPPERLSTMIQESSCQIVLHMNGTEGIYSSVATCTIDRLRTFNLSEYATDSFLIDQHNITKRADSANPRDSAFIVFTSGSTGKPKGVMVPHCGMTRYLHEPLFMNFVKAGDKFAQMMSIGFDAAQTEIFVTLSTNATLYLVGTNPLDTFSLVTILQITPTGLAALNADEYPNLRVIFVGGEQLPQALADRWAGKVALLNLYGPTEVSDNALGCQIFPNMEVTIGTPFTNSEVYVMDENLELVPHGVVGEVVVGGLCISNGYINSPEGNATKFIHNPLLPDRGKMYRTGDLGRWLPHGEMQMIGRRDNQVKLRGYRVELDEIANIICSHPLVKLAAAIIKENILIAYVSPDVVSKEELRSTVAKHLPHYMIPASFVGMNELPMNSNGKIDRALLNKMPLKEIDASDLELGELEQKLEEIWTSILKPRQSVGRNTSFFELGGDSMSVVRMTVAAAEAGFGFTAANVFKTPFLRDLAAMTANEDKKVLLQQCHDKVQFIDLGNDSIEAVQAQCLVDHLRGFNLASECPRKLTVIAVCDVELRLVFTMHHAIYDEKYWTEALQGVTLEAGSDGHSKGLIKSIDVSWEEATLCSLQHVSSQNGTTIASVLRAIWALVLRYYSRSDDIIFGDVHSGRDLPIPEIDRISGSLMNTVPFRVKLNSSMLFKDALKCAHNAYASSLQFDHASLVEIKRWMKFPGNVQMFGSIFLFQGHLRTNERPLVSGLVVDELETTGTTWDQWGAEFSIVDSVLKATISYDSQIFSDATITGMLRKIGDIISLISKPDADKLTIGDLETLSPHDKDLIRRFGSSASPQEPTRTLFHSRFEQQAAEFADSLAVVQGDKSITYGELDLRANAIAHILKSLGVVKGQSVGLLVSRSIEMVLGIFGALKAGATYTILDAAFPTDRLSNMALEARCAVILHMDESRETLDDLVIEDDIVTFCLSDFLGRRFIASNHRITKLQDTSSGKDNAFIVFTSGSTGKPKGVMVHHAGVTRLLDEPILYRNIKRGDKLSQFHSIGFDLCQQDVCMALSLGATLHLRTSDDALAVIKDVNILTITPTGLAALDPTLYSNIEVIYTCGENLPQAVSDRWASRAKLFNVYGPAETSLIATGAQMVGGIPVTIGSPLANTEIYICDGDMNLVPPGVNGVICIGGSAVTNGYINSPKEQNDKFIKIIVDGNMRGVYATGDVGRWLPDGKIHILGRMDNQVKLKGYRIELDEVANSLSRHPLVKVASAIVKANILVAYFSPRGATSPDLHDFIAKHLPHYMVPARYVGLDALPLNANGKIDRKALAAYPLPEMETGEMTLSDNERLLADIWRSILDCKQPIGAQTSFFELGGDSLNSIQMVAEAAKEGFDFNIATVFKSPFLRALASRSGTADAEYDEMDLDNALISKATLELLEGTYYLPYGIQSEGVEDIFPVSSLQSAMVAETLVTKSKYVVNQTWEADADITIGDIQIAWDTLLRNYAVLRSRFMVTTEGIFQVVLRKVVSKVTALQSSQVDIEHFQAEFMEKDLASGFEISTDYFARLAVIEIINSSKKRIILTLHHAETMTFIDLLNQVRETYASSLAFDHVSLANIKRWLPLKGNSKLFSSIFIFQNGGADDGKPERKIHLVDLVNKGTTLDQWSIEFSVVMGQLQAVMSYDTRFFTADAVRGMLQKVNDIVSKLMAATACGEVTITQLGSLAPNHVEELRDLGVAKHQSRPTCPLFQRRFEELAKENPLAVAVVYGDNNITYGDLDASANAVAHKLAGMRVTRGHNVGLIVNRSIEMLVGIFGVLKAGAAYVILDAGFPLERLRTMAEEASCNVVLHMDGTNDVLANLDLQIPPDSFSLSEFVGLKFARSVHNISKLNIQTTGADTAFIVFTSGSTGKPKGVMVPHYGMTRFANEPIVTENIHAGDKVAHFLSIGFDAAQWDTYVALSRGATLYLRGEDALSIMKQVDVVQITPSGLAALDPGAVGNLRVVYVGGEPLPQKLADEWCEKVKLYNICGPTEVSDIVLGGQMMKNEPVNIGGPLANSLIYIVDEQMNLVPPGVIGEIVVGGLTVSNGYINSAEGNATKFGPNPFDVSAGRIYCTGDLGRWLPNGKMQIIGRRDNQVKVRGYRMELDDIANTISGHPGVRLAAVVVKDNVLIAYVTPKGIPSAELRDIVSARMPHYMVPACFVGMDALPLNANGKIDRALLKTFSLPETSEDDLQLSEVEEALAQVWRSVLKTTVPIGQNTSFFELGGDSISAIRLMAMAKQAGMGITAAEIMKHVTLRSMAAVVKVAAPASRLNTTDSTPILGRIPLTPIQHMFFEQSWNNINHYNQSFLFKLKSRIDLKKFKEIEAPSSSTTYTSEEAAQTDDEMAVLLQRMQTSLSLEEGRLYSAALITVADGTQRIFFTIHHLVVDLLSWRILAADLETLLTGGRLAPKTTSFKEWSVQMIATAAGYDPSAWEPYMNLSDRKEVADRDLARKLTFQGVLDAGAASKLDATNVRYGTNIQELILAGLLLSMANLQDEDHIELSLDLEGHGREPWDEELDVSATVGWFTTIYPMHLTATKSATVVEVIQQVKRMVRGVPDKGLSYGVLKHLALFDNPVKAHARNDIAFNYFGRFQSMEDENGFLTIDESVPELFDVDPAERGLHPITINCMHSGDTLLVDLSVTEGSMPEARARMWMEGWAKWMKSIVELPEPSVIAEVLELKQIEPLVHNAKVDGEVDGYRHDDIEHFAEGNSSRPTTEKSDSATDIESVCEASEESADSDSDVSSDSSVTSRSDDQSSEVSSLTSSSDHLSEKSDQTPECGSEDTFSMVERPEAKPFKVLCLHGFGASAKIMEDRLKDIADAIPEVEFIFTNAPFVMNDVAAGHIIEGPYHKWFADVNDSLRAEHIQYSAKKVMSLIGELGGVDGLIGVGQGAELVQYLDSTHHGTALWRFNVLIACGNMIQKSFYYKKSLTRSLHIVGSDHEEARSAIVRKRYAEARILRHNAGQDIPRSAGFVESFSSELRVLLMSGILGMSKPKNIFPFAF
ncbi:hypothetical protein HK101_001504 [Irineochytrium annulatum]|nr:hypothetical protein HK101_001504 [Irineochytrium annulatum]